MRLNTFPNGRTDAVVKAWLAEQGISVDIVRDYMIERGPRDSTITIVFHFDDPEASADTADARGARVLKDRDGDLFKRAEGMPLRYCLNEGSHVFYTYDEIVRDYGPVTVVEQ